MTEPDDVIDILAADHALLRDLADRLDRADQPAELRGLYLRIVEVFVAHESAEEEILLPAFRAAVPAGGPTATARAGEHEEVDDLLEEMRGLSPDGYSFEKRASALALELRAHLDNEEETVFPVLRAALGRDELVELGRKLAAAKDHAPAFHGHHHTDLPI